MWPEPPDYISQGFGSTPYPFEPYDPSCPSKHFHTGIDIADAWGTPVRASQSGVVHIFVSSYGYGLHIIMNHGNGFFTVYGHLSSFAVGDGTYVSRGTVIGYEGSTGNSSGPHLHFEIREGQTPVNPLAFLP
jgi:murein DD-endopeptidase MepM/ murein hydrolase activator NlpD